jgi:hypothetical protein
MFDTVTAGPAAGIVASFAALIVGLQVTPLTVTLYGVTPLICGSYMVAAGAQSASACQRMHDFVCMHL